MYTTHLTPREKDVLKFISKNQGCSKQAVVDAFSEKHSRITVFNIIGALEDFELITILRNPENRQTNSIFLGDGSIISRVDAELESLETAINGLILKMNSFGEIEGHVIYAMAGLVPRHCFGCYYGLHDMCSHEMASRN